MRSQHIIPAIIPETYEHLRSRLKDVQDVVRRVQIDVMDGTYAPTTSWPYIGVTKDAFEATRREDAGLPYWQDFNFEIDLLLKEPEKRINEWALAGVSTLIFHVESTDALPEISKECFARRIEMALAIRPTTDISVLEPYVGQMVFVQVMGNERIGHHGVTLSEQALATIKSIHTRWPELLIGVDIGVNAETLPKLVNAGARRFAAGSAVFNFSSPAGALLHLESIVSKETGS